MSDERVDILLATYNGEYFVAEQIRSILDQTHQNIRLIIRDDASTDGTRAILETFSRQHPDKIKLLPPEKNLGIRGNFSKLMEHAEANYVMFSDQDDIWLPEKISKTLDKMNKAEEIYGAHSPLLVHTDLTVTDKNLMTLHPSFWNLSRLRPTNCRSLRHMLVQNNVTGCTMMINKSLLQLSMPIPLECIMHDWWIGLTAAAFGHIDTISEPTMLYRQHGNNAVGAKSLWQQIKRKVFHPSSLENQKLHQAIAFQHRYGSKLDPQQRLLLQNYTQLLQSNPLQKPYLMMKHRFYSNTTLNTLLRLFKG